MRLDIGTVNELSRAFSAASYSRLSPLKYKSTPLGMGEGDTRFSSPLRTFLVLYAGKDLKTAIAETVIRDRFEGNNVRNMMLSEFVGWGVVSVSATVPLLLLDIRTIGCLKLGVSTDIKGAKAQAEAREFSQSLHDQSPVDGILYRSRLTGLDCIAVYNRAVGKLVPKKMRPLVGFSGLVPALRALRVNLIK